MTTPEGIEKDRVKEFLRAVGAYQFWPVQSGYGQRTIDCLACVKGHFVGIEVKKKGYRPSDFKGAQIVTMKQMRAAGGRTFSGDAEEIIRWMQEWLSAIRS